MWEGLAMLSSVVTHDIYDVGPPIADLGETDKSQEWVQAGGKTRDGEAAQKAKGAILMGSKGSGEMTWKHMWFDFVAVGTPSEQLDQQHIVEWVNLWKVLKLEQQELP